MGSRGKKRRRADGSIARSVVPKPPAFPPLIQMQADDVPAVDPDVLARCVSIEARFVPLEREAFRRMEDESDDGLDSVYRRMESAILEEVGDTGMAPPLFWRTNILVDFLRDHGGAYHDVADDGTIVIDDGLLHFAATSVVAGEPGYKLGWPEP